MCPCEHWTVVEHSTRNPKVECSYPATGTRKRENEEINKLINVWPSNSKQSKRLVHSSTAENTLRQRLQSEQYKRPLRLWKERKSRLVYSLNLLRSFLRYALLFMKKIEYSYLVFFKKFVRWSWDFH
jgi:hypothetical protein